MKITFLGNRVQDLGGFKGNKLQSNIKTNITNILDSLKKEYSNDIILLTSISLGVETWAVESAFTLNIPYITYIPFKGYHEKWVDSSKRQYLSLLKTSNKIITIDNGPYSGKKLIEKDIRLITDADIVVFAFSTPNQFTKLASEQNKIVYDVMPSEVEDDFFIAI